MPFTAHHEGYYGKETVFVKDQIQKNILVLPLPHIVLIQIGSNDQSQSVTKYVQTFMHPLQEIIEILRKKNASVTILVGSTTCCGRFKNLWMNHLRESLVTKLDKPTSRVILVDHQIKWISDPRDEHTDTFDWVHPNVQGQKKMANNWMNAMKPFLKLNTLQSHDK